MSCSCPPSIDSRDTECNKRCPVKHLLHALFAEMLDADCALVGIIL